MLTIIISLLSIHHSGEEKLPLDFKLLSLKRELAAVVLAAYVWWFAFSGLVNFWYGIFFAASVLFALSLTDIETAETLEPSWWDILTGAVSGFLMYLLFLYSARFVDYAFPFLYSEVKSIDSLRMFAPAYIYAPVTLTVSVSEEFFWRGYILHKLYRRIGPPGIFLSVLLYSIAHIPTGKFSLVLAAAGAGTLWSLLFVWRRNLIAPLISHVVWDIFLLLWGL